MPHSPAFLSRRYVCNITENLARPLQSGQMSQCRHEQIIPALRMAFHALDGSAKIHILPDAIRRRGKLRIRIDLFS
jgi:hypothetical protein